MRALAIAFALVLVSTLARADELPSAEPAQVGLSSERLNRITQMLRADSEKGTIPGAVLLVARHGKIALFEAVGLSDPGTKAPMTRDTLFRIYSMTKPITTVSAMVLFEEGRLQLSDPVAKYIAPFGGVKVGVEKPAGEGAKPTLELVAAKRPMSLQDLMRHTSGLTYGFFGDLLVKKQYVESGLMAGDYTNAEFVERLAKLPLAFQPGTTWDYSYSTDVLGRVVEVVEGKTLLQVMKQRLFEPLGMKDSSFYVTDKAKHSRIAEPFPNDRSYRHRRRVQRPAPVKQVGVGRRRTDVDGDGLCPLRADAAQRRHARWQALLEPENSSLHGVGSHGRRDHPRPILSARPRLRIWPGLRGAAREWRGPVRRYGWRLLLGRGRRHVFLGRPERGYVRRLHDAVAEATRVLPWRGARHGVCSGGEVAARQMTR